jgi:diguanylate cyclase (GGDEF)-like protein
VTSNGDRLYHLGALPIVDASGRNVGEIVVMKDVTARMENIHETIRYVALIASALALLVFAFFYELLLRADHAIKADHARLTDDLGNQQKLFQAQIDQLENRALYDPLTELPNRTLFKDRLQHEIHVAQRDKKPIAVVLMTVTNMKSVADTLGHRVGDDVLKQIAWRLRQGLRKSDTIAKSGTDEFGALLPSVDLDLALDIVNKIDAMLRQSFMVNNVTVDLTTHIGVAIYPFHHQDPAALLRQADSAMRTARDEKLSYAIFDSTQESQKQKQLVLITDLHRAITNDDLELHYFPKVDIARGQVLGVEALLRWRHHDYGLIAPEEIIALAEKTGLIRTLTRWIVDKAIRQQATWLRANIDLAVAINISPLNLLDPFFSKQLEEMLLKRNVPMQNILLEISEQAITSDPAKLAGAMTKLSGQGFKFAIDDIGTGNSVLPYLKRLPVTEIKLDESLVYTLTDNSNNLAFVRSTIKLAHDLGIKVVAEGIKNKAILEQLTGLHCDIGQGYHINQPSNSSAFECWLVNSKYGAGVNSGAVCNIQDA